MLLLAQAAHAFDNTYEVNFSVFTRPLNNEYDTISPRGPQGVSILLFNEYKTFTFSEHGLQRYDIKFPDFKADNENRTAGEPKRYRFQPGERWYAQKNEVYTYRTDVRPMPLLEEYFTTMMRTIFYGIKWETWQDQQDMIRSAIVRETTDPMTGRTIPDIQEMLGVFVDGLNGVPMVDMHDYSSKKEEKKKVEHD